MTSSGIYAQITTVESQIRTLYGGIKSDKTAEAEIIRSANNAVIATETYDQNDKIVNEIFLNTAAKENLDFSATQAAQLWLIAGQCPLAGGNAVFKARSLYSLIDPEAEYNDDYDLCNAAGIILNQTPDDKDDFYAEKTEKKSIQEIAASHNEESLTVNPNPASDYLNIQFLNIRKGNILTLINSQGIEVLQQELKPLLNQKIDITQLPDGVYWLQCDTGNGNLLNHKIIIIN